MSDINVYNYHPVTGLYLSTSTAALSPLDETEVPLVPAYATLVAPPAVTAGLYQIFRGGQWQLLPDHRGEVWYDVTGNIVPVVDFGDPTALGLTQTAPPPPPATQDDYKNAVQSFIDATAKARNYTDGNSCVSYVGDTVNPQWAAEAAWFKSWRSEVWDYVFAQLAAVMAGARSQPTIDALIAEINQQFPIAWPTAA